LCRSKAILRVESLGRARHVPDGVAALGIAIAIWEVASHDHIRAPPEVTPKGFHDTLVRRLIDAMTVVAAKDLTIEELWALIAVIEPAIGR
jgi:hypothetical protein